MCQSQARTGRTDQRPSRRLKVALCRCKSDSPRLSGLTQHLQGRTRREPRFPALEGRFEPTPSILNAGSRCCRRQPEAAEVTRTRAFAPRPAEGVLLSPGARRMPCPAVGAPRSLMLQSAPAELHQTRATSAGSCPQHAQLGQAAWQPSGGPAECPLQVRKLRLWGLHTACINGAPPFAAQPQRGALFAA